MGGDSELHENWLGSVWRSVETMRYVVCELGRNNSGEQRVLGRSRTFTRNFHRMVSKQTGCTYRCKTCALPDRQRSFQRVLRVDDCNLFVSELRNRLKPFGVELVHRDPLIRASLALRHLCCFSVRDAQLPQCHLHRVPVQKPSSYLKDWMLSSVDFVGTRIDTRWLSYV